MSKISLATMFILSAALTACSDSRSSEQLTRSEPFPVSVEARQGMGVATVYFSFDGVQLNSQARVLLDAEAARMMKNAGAEYTVVGHADRVGSPDYNLNLGMRRAMSVVTYLVSEGVPRDRLIPTASFGELSPVVDVDQAERLNRRVVILQKTTSGSAKALVRDEAERARDRLAARPEQPQASNPPASGGSSGLPAVGELPEQETPEPSETADPGPQETGSTPGTGEGGGTGGETSAPAEEPANEQPSEPEDEQSPGNGNGNGNGGQGNGNGQGSGSNGGNQSGTHTDAGRGNGAEEGDPGNSGGRNQGGDND